MAAVSVTAPAERLGARRRREIESVLRDVVPPLLPPTLAVPEAVLAGAPLPGARRPATGRAL